MGLGTVSPLLLPMNSATSRNVADGQLAFLPRPNAMARHALLVLVYPVRSASLLAIGALNLHGRALVVLAA